MEITSSIQVFKYSSILAAALLVSCGGSDSKSSGSSADILQGSWQSNCTLDADNGDYDILKVTYDGNVLTDTHTVFTDANCTAKSYEFKYEGAYTLGEEITLDDDNKVHKLDTTFTKVFITLLSSDDVDTYNLGSVCSKTDWEKDKVVDVSDCLAFNHALGEIFNIVDVDGDKLNLGDTKNGNDGSNDAHRPTVLESLTHNKQ